MEKRKLWFIIGCGALGVVTTVFVISALLANAREGRYDGISVTPIPSTAAAELYTVPVEEFTLETETGSVALYDLSETPLVVRFFSADEEDLLDELAALQALSDQYEGAVLFLPVCAADEAERARQIFTQNGIGLCLYTDPLGEAKEACAITQVPSTVFIDVEGFLAARSDGAIDAEALRFGVSLIEPKY